MRIMTSFASTKEETNYFRLCYLLVKVGTQVLREILDRIHPPARLPSVLSNQRASLSLLRKGKRPILNSTQWEKLYPQNPSTLSSENFDISLLVVLLRTICGSSLSAGDFERFPPAADKSTKADIARLKYFRNMVYGHSNQASLSNETFNTYWQDISKVLLRLEGAKHRTLIGRLRSEMIDMDAGRDYHERLKQWVQDEVDMTEKLKQIQGSLDVLQNGKVNSACMRNRSVEESLQVLQKRVNQTSTSTKQDLAATAQPDVFPLNIDFTDTKNPTNRIDPKSYQAVGDSKLTDKVATILDEAINFHQSDCIEEARTKLRELSKFIQGVGGKNLRIPTGFSWQVVSRGKHLFYDGSVNCSVRYGTIILDSSNSGANFNVSLLDILAAFAVETYEFQIAKDTFSTLIDLHVKSHATSRLRDLGAAYNNRGCLSLIIGDFKQAENDFKNSIRHFRCEAERKKLPGLSVDPIIVAVNSNISRLNLMSRNFAEGLEEQEKLVQECKDKIHELPLQTIFMVMHNQAVIHTTLGNLPKAEAALRWMVRYCSRMRREECDFLLNFMSLQLCEVLLLRGKPEEANKVFPFEVLTTARVHEMMPTFGGLHFNVRIEAFEKMVDVFVKSGRIRFACDLLHKGFKIVSDAFGFDHFNVASLLYRKGSILKLMGDVSGSLENLKWSAEILEDIFGVKHPLLLKCYMSLGEVAFQLGLTDESHLYFQRAMENVEVIYQVSFPDQLSMKYIKITRNAKDIPFGFYQERKSREQMVEGLVAEYGQALAVLLSRIDVKDRRASRRPTTKGKQPLQEKKGKVQCPQSVLIISQKCIRDLLQSGQAMLHLGMTKEAAAFFQRASRYCQAYHQGHCSVSLVRLYTILSHTSLMKMNQSEGERNQVLNRYLQEITDFATNSGVQDGLESSSEDTETLTFDIQLNLKLVLILLILISIQLKMHDTTFAAHDLYASLSPDNDKEILSFKDRLQIYASRTAITCNGKTAVQDFLFTSAIGLIKNKSEGHLAVKPLFRSLAYKNNVPENRLLATCSAAAFLDIGDVKRLEQKTLRSFQEYFEINSLDSEKKATQVVVDITPSFCFDHSALLTGSRIELLPLCLSGEDDTKQMQNETRNISVIFPVLCEKNTCMTFADEPTSCFMFSRMGIWLFQQCNSGKISTLRVQNQCLVLTVTDPVKARIALWYEGRSIKQEVQLINIVEENYLSNGSAPQHSCAETEENPSYCNSSFDKFSPSAILQWAITRELTCETTEVERQYPLSVGTPVVSDIAPEPNGVLLNGPPMEKPSSSVVSEETEECQGLTKCFEVTTLKCLTAISEISRELNENVVHENDDFVGEHSEAQTDNISNPPDENVTASPPNQDTATGPPDQMQEAISNDPRQAASNHESDTESQNSSLSRAPCLTTTEANHLSLNERDTTVKPEDDTKLLGKMLFEEDRKARSSFIAKVSEELKKKDMSRKVDLFEHRKYSSDESSKEVVLGEPSHNEADHGESAKSDFKVNAEKVADFEERDEESVFSEDLEMSSSCKNLQTVDETERPDVLPTKKEATKEEDCTLSISAKSENKLMNELTEVATEQNQNDIMKNVLRNTGIETVILKQVTVVSPRECEAGCFDYNQILHQQQEDTQSGLRVKAQDEGAERVQRKKDSAEAREDYRNRLQEINEKEEEGNSRNGIRNNSFTLLTETLRLTSKEDDKAYLEGPWEQYLSNLNVSETDAGLWNSQSDDKESGVVAQNGKQKDDNLLLISGKEAHSEGWIKTTCRQFLDSDVIADGDVTHDLPQTDQDNVDGPILTPKKPWKIHSNKAAMGLAGGKEATSSRSRSDFQRLSSDETIKNGNPMPSEACDVVDGPVDPRRVDASTGYISPNFGGARPKEIFSKTLRNAGTSSKFMDPINRQAEKGPFGLDPGFVARHAVTNNSLNCSFVYLNCNGATWEEPPQEASDDHYFSANYCNSNGSQKILGERSLQRSNMPQMGSKITCSASEAFQERYSLHSNVELTASYQAPTVKQDESWHFPPLPNTTEKQASPHLVTTHGNQRRATQQNSTQVLNPLFDLPGAQSPYNDMVSMTNEFYSRSGSYGDGKIHSPGNSQADSAAVSVGQRDSAEDAMDSLFACLAKAMTRTVKLFASSDNVGKHAESEGKPVEKISVQEQASGDGENESTDSVEELNSREHAALLPQNDQTVDTVAEVPRTPVQESPRPVCSHYQRRCLVSFPCCGKFYPCHRCHNDSKACSYDQARAINATHIRCTICYHEQVIDEGSQKCRGCKSKMSAYFCAICKHFTSVDKNPFHCEKCGICRIHSDKSFHCDMCNVCLDKRLQGKHKCRPDSGHDECCICLEDAFSGCQILPCSHKVHKDCAIAMIQNGVRTCPICRHPLFKQPENTTQ